MKIKPRTGNMGKLLHVHGHIIFLQTSIKCVITKNWENVKYFDDLYVFIFVFHNIYSSILKGLFIIHIKMNNQIILNTHIPYLDYFIICINYVIINYSFSLIFYY